MVTFHVSILVSLWTFQLTYIYIYIYICAHTHTKFLYNIMYINNFLLFPHLFSSSSYLQLKLLFYFHSYLMNTVPQGTKTHYPMPIAQLLRWGGKEQLTLKTLNPISLSHKHTTLTNLEFQNWHKWSCY